MSKKNVSRLIITTKSRVVNDESKSCNRLINWLLIFLGNGKKYKERWASPLPNKVTDARKPHALAWCWSIMTLLQAWILTKINVQHQEIKILISDANLRFTIFSSLRTGYGNLKVSHHMLLRWHSQSSSTTPFLEKKIRSIRFNFFRKSAWWKPNSEIILQFLSKIFSSHWGMGRLLRFGLSIGRFIEGLVAESGYDIWD